MSLTRRSSKDSGKNGNYYSILGLYLGVLEKKMETIGAISWWFFAGKSDWLPGFEVRSCTLGETAQA